MFWRNKTNTAVANETIEKKQLEDLLVERKKREQKYLKEQGEKDMLKALLSFTLAHTELICFESQLKSDIANRLSTISEESLASSEEISAATDHISGVMDQLSLTNGENVKKLSDLQELKQQFELSISNVVDNSTQLHSKISEIDTITKDIADLAKQTNLLSLNASIEAARAGDSGKGFAVVAEEVRKLSAQTQDSVVKVSDVARNIENSSNNTETALNTLQEKVTKYMDTTAVLNSTLEENVKQINQSTFAIHELNSALEEQSSASSLLVEITNELHESSEFGEKLSLHMKDLYETIEPYTTIKEEVHMKTILAARLNEHASFLRNVVQNVHELKKVPTHKDCQFGKWIEENKEKFGHLQSFQQIYNNHKTFHIDVQELLNECSIVNARKLLYSSSAILHAFMDLSEDFR